MTKDRATRVLYRYYRLLEDKELKIFLEKNLRWPKYPREICGYFVVGNKGAKIGLNPSKKAYGGIVLTLLHELTHLAYIEWSESRVDRYSRQLYRSLSNRQLTNLIRRAFMMAQKKESGVR